MVAPNFWRKARTSSAWVVDSRAMGAAVQAKVRRRRARGLPGVASELDEEDAGARVGAEVAGVRGESADVDYKGSVGIEKRGGDGGVGCAIG